MQTIQTISFEEILPFWQKLWPGRQDIEKLSYMNYPSGWFSKSDEYVVEFLACTQNGKILGVTSWHETGETEFARHRGLWVDPDRQGEGIATRLIEAACESARCIRRPFKLMWAFPRQGASMRAHEKAGFVKVSDWTNEGLYGPNCYALRTL